MRSRRNLCVAIGGPTMRAALATLAEVGARADMVELRLDLIHAHDLRQLLEAKQCPAIVTVRPVEQGGQFTGDEASRLGILLRAVDAGAEWIDIELAAAERLGSLKPAGRIVSFHDFQSVPDHVEAIVDALWGAGGDVAKLATMVREPHEAAVLLRLLDTAPGPSIVLGMGAPGVASRVLSLRSEACFLTYVSAERGLGTAPGQVSLDDMEEVYRARSIGPGTRAIGYLGPAEDVAVLRAANAELARLGLDAVCVPLGLVDVERALLAIDRLGLAGALISDRMADDPRWMGSIRARGAYAGRVNTLVVENGETVGGWGDSAPAQVRFIASAL